MRRIVTLAVVAMMAMFTVAVSYFFWLPDIVTHHKTEVATASSVNGDRFSLTQQWGIEFYATNFVHVGSDGRESQFRIDPDDVKIWSAAIAVDENAKTAALFVRGKLRAEYQWDTRQLSLRK